jgi:rod shape determining protein RodA
MKFVLNVFAKDILFNLAVLVLLALGLFELRSVAPHFFPLYYLYYFFGIVIFLIFSATDFRVFKAYYWYFYILSLILLLLVLAAGQTTRGTIRWVSVGGLTIQPSELARPFLILFCAVYINLFQMNFKRVLKLAFLLFIPVYLILIQPSLSVAILVVVGVLGAVLTRGIDKRFLLYIFLAVVLMIPIFGLGLRSYQKDRILSFLDKKSSQGASYNSIQSMIAVGSGMIVGRNLGKGVQTQLQFLPEKHSDFIFAAIAEEMGFVGSLFLLLSSFVLLWRMSVFLDNTIDSSGKSFIAGVLLSLFVQIFVHSGMNMGMLPIAGIPFPIVSAGGSSFLATMISLGISLSAYKKINYYL